MPAGGFYMPKNGEPKTKNAFQGFRSPNYTQVPDELFDELLADLSGAEVKVLLYIIRRTFGFKKESDAISFNQICSGITSRRGQVLDRGTGLSKSTAQIALKSLVDKNIVVATKRVSPKRGNEPTLYSLNLIAPYAENRHRAIPRIGIGLYRESALQETEEQETVRQETGLSFEWSNSGLEKTPFPSFSKRKSSNFEKQAPGEELPDPELTRQRTAAESSGPRAIGELISLRMAQQLAEVDTPAAEKRKPGTPARRGRPPKVTEWIQAEVERFSDELHDSEHLPQNVGQAARLWKASGLSESAFCQLMGEARAVTKQYNVKKRAPGQAGELGLRNKMPYFFKVLRDLLGMKTPQAHA
jgi:phage replication O-like protein O